MPEFFNRRAVMSDFFKLEVDGDSERILITVIERIFKEPMEEMKK